MSVFCRKSKLCKLDNPLWSDYKDRLKSYVYNLKDYNLIGTTTKEEVDYFIEVYNKTVSIGKHDLGFVCLYDLKPYFKKSFWSFRDLVQSVICSKIIIGINIMQISNITYGVDKRKRFYLYNGKAIVGLKIKLINYAL